MKDRKYILNILHNFRDKKITEKDALQSLANIVEEEIEKKNEDSNN